MLFNRLSAALAGLLFLGVTNSDAGEPAVPEVKVEKKLPDSPSQLFAAVTKDTRPQWRQYFRESTPHATGDRYKAALALGAACADCYLAAEVRDAQQVRNMLTDMASLEMMLGITSQMSPLRQKVTSVASAGDWPGVRTEIASLMSSHAQFLSAQKDGNLAELERIGCWVRAFHICARFSSKQTTPPAQCCIWSPALLSDLYTRAVKLNSTIDSKTLQMLAKGLETLTKTWTGETTGSNAAARLSSSLPLLDSLVSELIDDEPHSGGTKLDNQKEEKDTPSPGA